MADWDILPSVRGTAGSQDYGALISRAEQQYRIPSGLLRQLIWTESKNDPSAYNKSSGATGIAQIEPATAANPGYGLAPHTMGDPASDIDFAGQYLAARHKQAGTWLGAVQGYGTLGGSPQNPDQQRLWTLASGFDSNGQSLGDWTILDNKTPSASSGLPSASSGLPGVTPLDPKHPFTQPFREVLPDIQHEITGAWQQTTTGFEDIGKAGIWTKSIAAFDMVAGIARIAGSPVTGAVQSFIGDPFERVTGLKGSSDIINTAVQLGVGFYGPVVGAIDRLVVGAGKLDAADQFVKALAPTSRGVFAARGERALRELSSQIVHDKAMVDTELGRYERVLGSLNQPGRLDFIHRMETGQGQLTPALQAAADSIRRLFDERWLRVHSLGPGHLDAFIDNYFPHIWKDSNRASAIQAELTAAAKRPLKGRGEFRKLRTIPTIRDGIARGLELVDDNPLRLAAIRLQSMDRYYHAQRMLNELKSAGLVKFFRLGLKATPGFVKLVDDPAFRIFLPPAVAEHFTAYDPEIRAGLEAVARHLGIDIKTKLTDPILRGGTYGYTGSHLQEVVARFGGDEALLMHEIGHQLDFKYGLAHYFGGSPQAWRELRDLALKRAPGATDPAYLAYLTSPPERIANLFHAYWHMPETFRAQAPTAARMLDDLLARNPALKQVADLVKPSVQLRGETRTEKFFGLRYTGDYYAPEQLATLIHNYLSQGLKGAFNMSQGAIGSSFRMASNAVNMAQLSFSGFHLMFTTFDAMWSRMALGFQQLAKLDPRGLVTIATVPAAPIKNLFKGGALKAAYNNPMGVPPNHEMSQVMDMLIKGGGRASADEVHKILNGQPTWKRIASGTFLSDLGTTFKQSPLKGIFQGAGQLLHLAIEATTEPIMGYWVPRQKLGVFYDMAKDFLRRNPNASALERQAFAIKAWDSTENRMGLMTYDNIFWNKTGKDIAFLAVRSVGWNLGTFRELGGAVFDAYGNLRSLRRGELSKLEMTPRMAYAAAMTAGTALTGATLTYLYTGHGPTEMMDYFFPPTGGVTATGAPERISIPGYLKDVVAFNQNAQQTALNKLNPWLSMLTQLWQNRDYYGGLIADPDTPTEVQLRDTARWAYRNVMPFSFQSMLKLEQSGSPLPTQVASFFGFQAAPGYIVDPEKAQAGYERSLRGPRRIKAREDAAAEAPPSASSGLPPAPATRDWEIIH